MGHRWHRGRRRQGSGASEPRVLFVSHYAGRTGAPLLLLHFLRWVRAHTTLRFEVLLLEEGALVEEFASLGPVHVANVFGPPGPSSLEARAPTFGFTGLAEHLRARRIRREASSLGRYDAVYLNSALSAEALRLLPAVPPIVVTSLHETDTAFSHFITQADRSLILEESDWFITCAEVVSATLVGGFDVDPDRIRLHHGFIPPLDPDPEGGRRLRKDLGIPDGATVVGGVGVLQWRKGPDLFLDVAVALGRRHPDLDLHFVWAGGNDPHGDAPPVADDAARVGATHRFHVLGEYGSAPEVFGAFDIFCLPSREDPFPLVALEAALLGVPIVAFANGGITELAGASGDPAAPLALVVDYLEVDAMVDAIAALAVDPEAAAAMAGRARRQVQAEHLVEVAAPRLHQDLRRLHRVFS